MKSRLHGLKTICYFQSSSEFCSVFEFWKFFVDKSVLIFFEVLEMPKYVDKQSIHNYIIV